MESVRASTTRVPLAGRVAESESQLARARTPAVEPMIAERLPMPV